MNNVYHDRGIIKWAPFDALVGYQSLLNELRYRRNKEKKPILTDDQYDYLNQKLLFANEFNKAIRIHYYVDGYTKTVFGHIYKLDWTFRKIILDGRFHIFADSIIEIDVFDDEF